MRNNQTSRNEHHTFYNEPKVFYLSNSNNSSRYPTLSIILPILHKLLHVTLKARVDDDNLVKEIKRVIGTDLELRYQDEEIRTLLRIATYLDPRFKLLSFLDEVQKLQVKLDVKHD